MSIEASADAQLVQDFANTRDRRSFVPKRPSPPRRHDGQSWPPRPRCATGSPSATCCPMTPKSTTPITAGSCGSVPRCAGRSTAIGTPAKTHSPTRSRCHCGSSSTPTTALASAYPNTAWTTRSGSCAPLRCASHSPASGATARLRRRRLPMDLLRPVTARPRPLLLAGLLRQPRQNPRLPTAQVDSAPTRPEDSVTIRSIKLLTPPPPAQGPTPRRHLTVPSGPQQAPRPRCFMINVATYICQSEDFRVM